jgi:iron complex transport system substrate-binding protein
MIFQLRVRFFLAALACCALVSCNRQPEKAASTQPTATKQITVASLSPAATDIIAGIGAGDHLIAVSNYDADRPGIPNLPHVGDYQNTDWEKLAQLQPTVIIVQMDPSRIPPGLRERAEAIGASMLDVQIENLADISRTIDQLGAALNEPAMALAAQHRLQSQLQTVHMRVALQAPIPTLLALDDSGTSAAGPGTFLDEVLTIAGGSNVLAGTSEHWPSVDKERLLQLSPAAVIQFLPGATPQVLAQAKLFWQNLPTLPAVAQGRVYPMTDPRSLIPGLEVGDLAEHIAAVLHPQTATTQGAP